MIKTTRIITLAVACLVWGGVQAVAAEGQIVDNRNAGMDAYRVGDPEIIRISRELLGISDAEVKGLEMPNPHPDAQWFPKAGLGLFMHWGIHSVVGAQPSWSMIKNYPCMGPVNLHPPAKYFALADKFDPKKWNPDKWLGTAKAAGFTYAVLTTKHHDGYALWPSRFGNFSTREYLEGRDLLKPYVAACRKHGLKVGFYFSPRDWHYPDFPVADFDFDYKKRFNRPAVDPKINRERFEPFFAFTIGQLHELLTRYGKIDVLWFDGMHWQGIDDMHTKAVYQWIRSLQPGIVINDRWSKVRNPDDTENKSGFGDFGTLECDTAKKRPDGWWETCDCWDYGGGWGYDKKEQVRNLEWILNNLVHCRQWGGNFLPNLGPRPDGEMTRGFYEGCKALEDWMAKHRDSVVGTTAHPKNDIANVPVTCRPGAWYIHISPKHSRSEKIVVKTTRPIRNAYLMRSGVAVPHVIEGDTYQFDLPPGALREVIVLEFAEGS